MTYREALKEIRQAAKWVKKNLQSVSRNVIFGLLLIFCLFLPSCFRTGDEPTISPQKMGEISVSLPNLQLDFFDQHDRQEILARHLASSAAWKVEKWSESKYQSADGVWHKAVNLSAFRRNWQTACGGWQTTDINESFIQLGLSSTAVAMDNSVQVIENSVQKIKIESYTESRYKRQKPNYTTLNSAIHIANKSRRLLLHISERSDDLDRTFTTNFLENISRELTQLSKSSVAFQSGFAPKLLAPKSMINAQKSVIQIDKNGQGFECSSKSTNDTTVSGYVNPGEAGYIYVVTEFETNKGIYRAKAEEKEYVGWSDSPAEQFFFALSLYLRGSDLGDRPVKFQLWFHPSKGGTDRILLKKTAVAMVNSGMWGEFFEGKKK